MRPIDWYVECPMYNAHRLLFKIQMYTWLNHNCMMTSIQHPVFRIWLLAGRIAHCNQVLIICKWNMTLELNFIDYSWTRQRDYYGLWWWWWSSWWKSKSSWRSVLAQECESVRRQNKRPMQWFIDPIYLKMLVLFLRFIPFL